MTDTIDTTKLSVSDIRHMLMSDYGLTQEEVDNLKGKAALANKLLDFYNKDDSAKTFMDEILSNAESDEKEHFLDGEIIEDGPLDIEDHEVAPAPLPERGSVEWNDYVMSQFTEDELILDERTGTKNPKTDALRRVVTRLIGNIVESGVIQHELPSGQNGYRSVVVYNVTVRSRDGEIFAYSDIAEAYKANTPAPFDLHMLSTASTRAEGRCLRKILMLKNVVAQEELAGNVQEVAQNWDVAMISDTQINFINTLCSRTDIDVMKYINVGQGKFNKIEEVPFVVAQKMVEKLSSYQNDPSTVPACIKGYRENWRF